MHKAIGKCQIKTPRRVLGSSLRFLAVRERWVWLILAIWIAHSVLFLFINGPAEKNYAVRTLIAEPPPPMEELVRF